MIRGHRIQSVLRRIVIGNAPAPSRAQCIHVDIDRRVGQKMIPLVFQFLPLLDALNLQFLFTRISFSLK